MLKILRFYKVSKCHLTRMYTQKVRIEETGTDLQKAIDQMPRIRSSNQPPKIWQVIERINMDGKPIKFTIQEIPEDRYKDAVQHMCTHILADEPICQCTNAKNDSLFVQDLSAIWHLLFAQGISIAAFIDNPNHGKPIIVAVGSLGVHVKNEKNNISDIYQCKSENFKLLMEFVNNMNTLVYERYGINKYLWSIGISVDPNYRRHGLGKNLLKVRDLIGTTYGISVTAAFFSSLISQKFAINAGFEELMVKKFSDMVDKDGNEYFPNINTKMFKIMSKKLY